jgi:hypothetical protein
MCVRAALSVGWGVCQGGGGGVGGWLHVCGLGVGVLVHVYIACVCYIHMQHISLCMLCTHAAYVCMCVYTCVWVRRWGVAACVCYIHMQHIWLYVYGCMCVG